MPIAIRKNTITTERSTYRPWVTVKSDPAEDRPWWSDRLDELQSVLLTCLTGYLTCPTDLDSAGSVSALSEGSIQQTQLESLKTFVGERLGAIDGVECIYLSIDKRDVDVWIITSDYDFDRNDRIYEQRQAVYQAFDDVALDFRILPKDGRPDRDLVPAGAERIALVESYALC